MLHFSSPILDYWPAYAKFLPNQSVPPASPGAIPLFSLGGWSTMADPEIPLIARFMVPTWGPSGADRTQVGPMLPHELCYLGHLSCNNHYNDVMWASWCLTTGNWTVCSTVYINITEKIKACIMALCEGNTAVSMSWYHHAVKFSNILKKKKHSITCLWGRVLGCIVWIHSLTYDYSYNSSLMQ